MPRAKVYRYVAGTNAIFGMGPRDPDTGEQAVTAYAPGDPVPVEDYPADFTTVAGLVAAGYLIDTQAGG